MKRLIITEEEKHKIMSLYEKVGEKVPTEGLGSKKGESTKRIATQLNQYYKINLKSASDGDWWSKEYNDTLAKFLKEKGQPVKYCKPNDPYCGKGNDGEVYTDVKIETLFNTTGTATNTGTTVTGKINTTYDKNYDYQFYNNKYWFRGKPNTESGRKYPKWVESTGKGLEAIKKNVKFV
jgi:hypothetical protein